MFAFRHYGNGRFYWVVPEVLYAAFLFGGALLALLAIGAVAWGVIRKRKRAFFVAWTAVLLVSALTAALALNGVIVADAMLGG